MTGVSKEDTLLVHAVKHAARTTHYTCPPLVKYDKTRQGLLADELEALPKDKAVMINSFLSDYSKLRDICRKIKKSTRSGR